MASGPCEDERDHPITLSFIDPYLLLPLVTRMLGLGLQVKLRQHILYVCGILTGLAL
jgi:hypothetical protein